MVLTIDIGNSNIVLGGYIQDKICFTARIATSRNHEADQYAVELDGILRLHKVPEKGIEGAIISSVVPSLTPTLQKALRYFTLSQPLLLELQDAGDLVVDIEHPAELGMDLLASAIAMHRHGPLPAVIIDMGTATKLIVIDKKGALRGVSIAPGLLVSLDAMLGSTSLLHGIALEASPKAIGRNSKQSIQSGVLLGTASMLDGMIDRIESELNEAPLHITATGGAAHMVLPYCRHTIEYSDTLLLDGLYLAYKGRVAK